MSFIRDKTKEMSDERYLDFLDQLRYEIESEMEKMCWMDDD